MPSLSATLVSAPDVTQAQHYISRAVASSTARTYRSAYLQYCRYYQGRQDDPQGRITLTHALHWLAALGRGGRHTAATIGIYRHGLSSIFSQTLESLTTVNPLAHSSIGLLMRGIGNENQRRDTAQRVDATRTTELTLALALELVAIWRDNGAHNAMLLAAVMLGVTGGLRPSELLGSRDHPERALTLDQLTFYDDDIFQQPIFAGDGDIQVTSRVLLANRHGSPQPRPASHVPRSCVLSLRITKTAQRIRPPRKGIGQPAAVAALWAWAAARRAETLDDRRFFIIDGAPLTTIDLVAAAQSALRALGRADVYLTGKCFRKGAASSWAASSMAPADITAAGQWAPGSQMWSAHYASSSSLLQRSVALNRAMV